MKHLKKGLGIILVMTMAISLLLSACKSKNSEENNETSSTTLKETHATQKDSEKTEEKEELKPVSLLWYTIGTPQNDQESVNKAMSEFTKEKINAAIEIQTIGWGEYNDKIKMLSAAGEEYDLCFTSSWANDYLSAVAKGAYYALDELLDKYGKNIYNQVPKKYFDAVKVKGETYAMLNYQILASSPGVMVRKDLAEKYNFDTSQVKKLADLEPFFEKVKDNESGITPYLTQGGDIPSFNLETGFKYDKATTSWGLPLYIEVGDPEYKVIDLGDTEERKALENLYRDWYVKEYIRKDAASITDFAAERKSGKYAAYAIGTLKPGGDIEEKNINGYEVIPVPVAPAYINTTSVIATLTAVSRTSKNPDRAVMFYDLMHESKELYNIACNGIEGKHYNKLDDKFIEPIADSGYAPGTDWLFGNQFNAYLKPGMDPDVWEKTIAFNESAEISPLLGFSYNPEAMKTEIAQVEAIVGEYAAAVATGTIDINKYREEIKKRTEDAGIKKIIADVQNQINEWLKTK